MAKDSSETTKILDVGSDSINSYDSATEEPVVKEVTGLRSFPPVIYLIIIMELMERYAYYGLRSVLTKYLKDELHYSKTKAKSFFSLANATAYCCPIIGAFVADEYLTKFWTIVVFGIFYVMGSSVLAISGFISADHLTMKKVLAFVALFSIAFATGGIKPNVSPFGAEQLRTTNTAVISTYFSIFYMCINVGSLAATLITPVIRDQFSYGYAFAIPAALLALAIALISSGKKWYYIAPASGSLLKKVFQVIGHARHNKKRADTLTPEEQDILINKSRVREVNGELVPDTKPHYFDYAKLDEGVSFEDVEDAKTLVTLLPLCFCFPLFWCFYNMQATLWLLQADSLNRTVFGITIISDQVQCMNALSILIVIPILEVVYARLKKWGYAVTYFSRIIVGMFVASVSFFCSAIIDWQIAEQGLGKISIAYQFIPYLLMAFAEGLVSVSGLSLFFSYAPVKFKSTVASIYNLTNAGGDLIAVILYNIFDGLADQYFSIICACLLASNAFITLAISNWFTNNVQCYQTLPSAEETDIDKLGGGAGAAPSHSVGDDDLVEGKGDTVTSKLLSTNNSDK